MWVELHDRPYAASDICSPATVHTMETYREAIPKFDEEEWTYMPLPADGKYYNLKSDELHDLDEKQIIPPDMHILDAMKLLLDYPFLLTEMDEHYHILNLSDINRRKVKEFIYPVISELENQLSNRIEAEYPESESLFDQVSEFSIGIWVKASRGDVQLHIAEFLTLGNMIGIIKGDRTLMDGCGFENSAEVGKLGGIEKLRNRVMHGNRALVQDREMLRSHIRRIERAEDIVKQLL